MYETRAHVDRNYLYILIKGLMHMSEAKETVARMPMRTFLRFSIKVFSGKPSTMLSAIDSLGATVSPVAGF